MLLTRTNMAGRLSIGLRMMATSKPCHICCPKVSMWIPWRAMAAHHRQQATHCTNYRPPFLHSGSEPNQLPLQQLSACRKQAASRHGSHRSMSSPRQCASPYPFGQFRACPESALRPGQDQSRCAPLLWQTNPCTPPQSRGCHRAGNSRLPLGTPVADKRSRVELLKGFGAAKLFVYKQCGAGLDPCQQRHISARGP